MKNKYYYREGDKQERLIEELSDSAAYLKAFEIFEISKKVYNDMQDGIGKSFSSKPVSFKLLNSKRKDITYSVEFANKDSLENDILKRIESLPNEAERIRAKIREEKHGVGAKYDTGGLYLAPIKVLSAKFVQEEYSNYKDIALRYKNVSDKPVTAVRFRWYGENAFNEPADMGGLLEGWGGGFSDETLRPGATDYGEWSILSRDGKKILIAYPYEVVFKDGTKWELSQ